MSSQAELNITKITESQKVENFKILEEDVSNIKGGMNEASYSQSEAHEHSSDSEKQVNNLKL